MSLQNPIHVPTGPQAPNGPSAPVTGTPDASGKVFMDVLARTAGLDAQFMDVGAGHAPLVDTATVTIPDSGAAPLQVSAAMTRDVKMLSVRDTTGQFTELLVGGVRKWLIHAGQDGLFPVKLSAGDVVSIRSTAGAITGKGIVSVVFLG